MSGFSFEDYKKAVLKHIPNGRNTLSKTASTNLKFISAATNNELSISIKNSPMYFDVMDADAYIQYNG
jgi:hypothetical protein